MWAKRIYIKPLNDNSTIVQVALDRVIQILIAYFKQYKIRKNCQEMQVRFYTNNSRQEKAFNQQYQNYIAQQQKYMDDQQEMAEDLEIYTEFEEQDSQFIESLDDI